MTTIMFMMTISMFMTTKLMKMKLMFRLEKCFRMLYISIFTILFTKIVPSRLDTLVRWNYKIMVVFFFFFFLSFFIIIFSIFFFFFCISIWCQEWKRLNRGSFCFSEWPLSFARTILMIPEIWWRPKRLSIWELYGSVFIVPWKLFISFLCCK